MIAPSILNADNLNLNNAISKATSAGITRFHLDIMDGHFVPNLSFGPQLVSDFKREFPMIDAEIHLMSDNPKMLIPEFVKAGADMIEIHYEAMSEDELNFWLDYLISNGVKPVLVLNPETPISVIKKFESKLKQVLLMTVHPGFGGQSFLPDSVSRIKEARALLDEMANKIPIEVDGGIDNKTIVQAKEAGAEIFVVGSYIFEHGDIVGQVNKLNGIIK